MQWNIATASLRNGQIWINLQKFFRICSGDVSVRKYTDIETGTSYDNFFVSNRKVHSAVKIGKGLDAAKLLRHLIFSSCYNGK